MGGTRQALHRTEKSGTLAPLADNLIFEIKYDMSSTVRLTPGSGQEALISAYPMAIYRYRIEIVGDYFGSVYQTYGDSDDRTNLTNFNVSNDEFIQGLKQCSMIAGTSTTMGKTVINYAAKKNPVKLRAKFGKWKRPPIYLGPSYGNSFYICTHNNSDSSNRTFNCHVTISSWKQFT
jgi:hypothetical protein